MKKNELLAKIKYVFEDIRQDMIFLVEKSISPQINNRRSTLSPHALATVLAHAALRPSSEKTIQWIKTNAQGMNIIGNPTPFSEASPFMATCYTVLEKVLGVLLPPQLGEKIPPVEDIADQLDYPLSYNTSYIIPLHLACAALLCTIKGVEMPQIFHMLSDLQQPDGSWTDDVLITALSALALQKGGVEPKYDVQKWLKREQLPDGSWAVANGEVWEAAYALKTGEVNTFGLVQVLKACMHPNYWWGFSRYSVPDIDDTAAACYALASYEPQTTSTVCEKLVDVQHENGGWGTFPRIEGVVPQESVVRKPRELSSDVTCHVLEALEQNNKGELAPFKRGMSYLLETQEQNGHWKTTWWKSDVYATTEITLLMYRNGYEEPAFHALNWLEKRLDEPLNTVEYALLIKTFSEFSDYSDSLNMTVHQFLEQYYSEYPNPTFDSVYFAGLIDCTIYGLSIIVSSLNTFLRKKGD